MEGIFLMGQFKTIIPFIGIFNEQMFGVKNEHTFVFNFLGSLGVAL